MVHGRHFVRHLGICNPICVKLLQIMSGVVPRNLKIIDVSISNRFPGVHKRGIYTDTHTHDDSIRRNAIRCISPKTFYHVTISQKQYVTATAAIRQILVKFLPKLTKTTATC